MTSWKFVTAGNFSTTNLSTFMSFFLSFGNVTVVPCDYQTVKNQNFFERVGKGPDKVSGNPRICPVSTQF